MNDKPAYYGILPACVRYDTSIPPMARIMYAEVSALSNKDGFCSAGNRYFADLYNVTTVTVSRWFSQMEKAGHFYIESDPTTGHNRKVYPLNKNVKAPIQKNQGPLNKNVKHNNTSIILQENNIEEAAKATSAPTVISNEDVKDFEEQVKDRKTKKRFAKPTLEEIKDYFQKKFREKKVSNPEELATQEADRFYNYYESNGWKVGRNKMTSWPHAVGGWIGRMPDYKLSGRVVSINSPKQNKNAIDAICSEETANELQAAFIAGGCNW